LPCCYNKAQDIKTTLIQYKNVFCGQYVKLFVVVARDRENAKI